MSYGYNWLGLCPDGRPLRRKEIRDPAGTLAFVDTDTCLVTPLALVGRYGGSPPAYRHEGIANAVWADGHAHGLTRRELEATDSTA